MNEIDASIVEKLLPMVNAVYITENGLDCRALLKLLIAKNLITGEEFTAAKKAEYETKDGRALQETKRELEAVFGAGFFDEDDETRQAKALTFTSEGNMSNATLPTCSAKFTAKLSNADSDRARVRQRTPTENFSSAV